MSRKVFFEWRKKQQGWLGPVSRGYFNIFGMATLPFLCNGTLLFQCNLPRVLPVTIYKYASCLIPFIRHLLCSMMHQKKKNHDQ